MPGVRPRLPPPPGPDSPRRCPTGERGSSRGWVGWVGGGRMRGWEGSWRLLYRSIHVYSITKSKDVCVGTRKAEACWQCRQGNCDESCVARVKQEGSGLRSGSRLRVRDLRDVHLDLELLILLQIACCKRIGLLGCLRRESRTEGRRDMRRCLGARLRRAVAVWFFGAPSSQVTFRLLFDFFSLSPSSLSSPPCSPALSAPERLLFIFNYSQNAL